MPPFDSRSPAPASTILPPERVPMVPTWDPAAEAAKSDVALTRIADAEINGNYTVAPDGSRPEKMAALAGGAFLDSDALQGGATRAATGLNQDEQRR